LFAGGERAEFSFSVFYFIEATVLFWEKGVLGAVCDSEISIFLGA
jgi:hypothetical protein